MKFFLPLILITVFSSCYTFRDISIPPEVNTYFVNDFDDKTREQVPGLAPLFTQSLKDRIRNESRLEEARNKSQVPDIEFSGFITKWEVNNLAPTGDATSALQQLKIYVKVKMQYRDKKFEQDEFEQTFNFGIEYSADQNLLDIQDELIERIFDQITTDIFNKAFTSW